MMENIKNIYKFFVKSLDFSVNMVYNINIQMHF